MAESKHWFHSKSPAAQKAYIAAHPNSIYARASRKKAATVESQDWKAVRKVNKAAHNARVAEERESLPVAKVSKAKKAKKDSYEYDEPIEHSRHRRISHRKKA